MPVRINSRLALCIAQSLVRSLATAHSAGQIAIYTPTQGFRTVICILAIYSSTKPLMGFKIVAAPSVNKLQTPVRLDASTSRINWRRCRLRSKHNKHINSLIRRVISELTCEIVQPSGRICFVHVNKITKFNF